MIKSIKKYIGYIVSILSAIVLFSDFINIINVENISLKVLFVLLFIISIPIAIASMVSLIKLRYKNIVIDNINMVTVNYEFDNYKELIKQTKRVEISSVNYIYEFQDGDFKSIRNYIGKSISWLEKVVSFPLVLAGDSSVEFTMNNCYAYDLLKDRNKNNKLYPNLLFNEGIYKFACYNFGHALKYNESFNIETYYTWPNCVSPKKDYILVSPIFKKKTFDKFNVQLRFFDKIPIRVKKYKINEYKKVISFGEIIKDSEQKNKDYISYTDSDVEMKENIAFFVYIFDFSD